MAGQQGRFARGGLSYLGRDFYFPVKTNVYVDGFNVYYGCLANSAFKWLDIAQLCALELPSNQINRIRYFTAQVKDRPSNLGQSVRQQTYLRALQTTPQLSVHFGHFLSSEVRMKLAHPIPGLPPRAQIAGLPQNDRDAFNRHGLPSRVQVIKSEEKGSDVNIAAFLLLDAFRQECDAAIIISNDSDLMTPIYIARKELGLRVGCLMPCRAPRRPSVELRKAASFHQIISDASLANSQFAPTLTDAKGSFSKPPAW